MLQGRAESPRETEARGSGHKEPALILLSDVPIPQCQQLRQAPLRLEPGEVPRVLGPLLTSEGRGA